MARIPIANADGTPTDLFWSDRREPDAALKTVYRALSDGSVQRSKSMRYNVKRKKLQRV